MMMMMMILMMMMVIDEEEEEEESICAWTDVGAFVFKGQSEFWATLMLMLIIARKFR